MSLKIGIYHGDEDWVLKGIGQDLAKFLSTQPGVTVVTTDQVFEGVRLDADVHIFVQQGQLNANCKKNKNLPPPGTICLFTHLDVQNFRPDILSKCKAIIFNSSIQLSMAIANGYEPDNAYLRPHAVDPGLHQTMSLENPPLRELLEQLNVVGKVLSPRSAVGFCGRYWEKVTYTRRKNYQKVKEVAYSLVRSGIPVVVLGPGWNRLFTKKHPLLTLLEANYQNYPPVYNLMKIFVSLSIHEGGPLPVLESMCCGAYPVVTNTGFAFDVLRGNSDGLLVDPFRSSEFYGDLIREKFHSQNWDPREIRKRASEFSFEALGSLVLKISSK